MKYIFIALILIATSVKASDDKDNYTILGMGTASCSSYVKASSNDYMRLRYSAWANGYFTHFNLVAPNTYDITGSVDLTAREQWLYNYCKKNILENFDSALKALVKEFKNRNQYYKRSLR